MTTQQLQPVIDAAWEQRDSVNSATRGEIRDAVEATLEQLDGGALRVAAKENGTWTVHQWAKKAVLLSFRLNDMALIAGGPGAATPWFDKVPSKFEGWGENRFREAGFRAVPGSIVRKSAYIAPGVVLMPSFVNLGAYVDSGHHGRYLGDGRFLRPDRQELPYLGRRRHRRRSGAPAGRAR